MLYVGSVNAASILTGYALTVGDVGEGWWLKGRYRAPSLAGGPRRRLRLSALGCETLVEESNLTVLFSSSCYEGLATCTMCLVMTEIDVELPHHQLIVVVLKGALVVVRNVAFRRDDLIRDSAAG